VDSQRCTPHTTLWTLSAALPTLHCGLSALHSPHPASHVAFSESCESLSQVSRLATTAQFVKLGLTDPEADPEAGSGGAKALRLKLKQRMFKQSLCEPRGIGLVEDLGDAGGEGGGGKGKKKRVAPEPEEAAKSDAEAEAEKMVKVGVNSNQIDQIVARAAEGKKTQTFRERDRDGKRKRER
jgi:hypothetical protein